MFETYVGAGRGRGLACATCGPETAQGIFVNFKNVLQLARRKPPFGIAQIGKSFRNEITPGNFLFRDARVRADGDGVLRAAGTRPSSGTATGSTRGSSGTARYGLRGRRLRVREHGPEERSHYSRGTSDIEYDYPIGWSELEGVANRGDFDLTQHTRALRRRSSSTSDEGGERYVPYVIEPASQHRADHGRHARRRLRRGGRRPTASAPCSGCTRQIAPVTAAVLPLDRQERREWSRKARGLYEELRRRHSVEYDDGGAIGAPLPAPGRDRHTVRVHRRRADARGRHGDSPRPRFTSRKSGCRSPTCATGSRLRSSATGSRRRRARRCAACAAGSSRSIRSAEVITARASRAERSARPTSRPPRRAAARGAPRSLRSLPGESARRAGVAAPAHRATCCAASNRRGGSVSEPQLCAARQVR